MVKRKSEPPFRLRTLQVRAALSPNLAHGPKAIRRREIDHLPHADLTSSPKTYRSSPATGQHAWAGNFALPHPPQTGRGRDGRRL